ncbi:MAG: hypothetical protein HYW91_00855 [Candidatus Sungbacteria bacterium]|nr:hypothetical protein [Candidatus Sungbacteria bacterium]
MDKFERKFRGRIFPTEEGVQELPREEGLKQEERMVREKLEREARSLSREERGRLEHRLEQIGRELHPRSDFLEKKSSIVKP